MYLTNDFRQMHFSRLSTLVLLALGLTLATGCSLGPWTSEQAQVDRFRHELAMTNFRLQRSHLEEVKQVFTGSRDTKNDLETYSDLVHKFASPGTSRLKDRLKTFEEIQIFLGGETFAICLMKKLPPMLLCDTSETPYIDRIQIDQPLPDMKSSLDRISGR
ncbi:MAG: hypothetical protein U1E10_06025 [Bdellovibrionales bacterium]|nr:hypothetical protein [Bdellovibrionales bacterium]